MVRRRILIMKVAAHIGEFTPRLRAHAAARYPYLAIPAVRYPHLERELFCNVFYLRHLCDTLRFPDWPIPDPVCFLTPALVLSLPHFSQQYNRYCQCLKRQEKLRAHFNGLVAYIDKNLTLK
jgi:hypothetical protein